MYGPLRLLYGLPSRRKKYRPATLPLKVQKTADSEWEYVPVVQERYPFLVTFPYFEAPGILAGTEEEESNGPESRRLWIRGASPHYDFHALLESLIHELGIYALEPQAKSEIPAFCSLLAKIALSYLAATSDISTQGSRLAKIALGEDMNNCMHYIGSVATDEPPSNNLHEILIGKHNRTNAIIIRIRLLAKLGTPTYFVAYQPC